ncbi:MAG: hypothetical protein JNM25_03680 [Planctomycetes bacterium]|nr:hypothetical protein [Planctomycetota bacterium]
MTATAELRPLRHCRMVLCLPGDDANTLASLRAAGVPAVTLDPAAAPARRLRHFRHRFDGVVCDLAAFGGTLPADLAAALDETLLPGGRLLLRGADAPGTVAPDLVCCGRSRGSSLWRKPRPTPPGAQPAIVRVAPYADLLVGCRRVIELGAGGGRFLDALRLRGIAAAGLEREAALAGPARARGHEVCIGGLADLPALARGADGLFVGHWLDDLDRAAVERVLQACRHVLPAGGRLLLRCGRAAAARLHEPFTARHWAPVHRVDVPLDADDVALLAFATGDPPPWPAGVADVRIDTAALPLQRPPRSCFDLERAERQVTSQGGEDGVLAELFARLGTTNRHYVEFGCGDGLQCNTTQLRRAGWQGLLMDGIAAPAAPDAVIHAAWITAENIGALLDHHGVPAEPDLLSIDVDGNDYWIWRAITRRPRVVVVEYNANLPADRALTMPYDPLHRWDGSDFYGASLLALVQLGRAKGYTLVYCTQAGVNAFFVRDDLLPGLEPVDSQLLYRAPNYWYRGARSRPDLTRAMVTV